MQTSLARDTMWYNDACETGGGWLKNRTGRLAAMTGRPAHWTRDDFGTTRRQANEEIHEAGELGSNHPKHWQARTPITPRERRDWRLILARANDLIHGQMDPHSRFQLTAADQAAVHRRAIRRACVESAA